jgi:RNA polymerase sigma-70 factor (ECF subfamily)
MAAEPQVRPTSAAPSSNGRSVCAQNGALDKTDCQSVPPANLAGNASGDARSDENSNWLVAIVDRFEGPLVRYAAQITGDLERGRDVAQETFLRLCREPAVAASDHLGQWLFTVCRRLAIDVRRKEKRMSTQLETAAVCEAPSRVAGQWEIEQSEYMANLVRQLARLPANQQEVVRLKFQEGMSYKEIGEITGLSASNVGYLLHVAVNELRERLKTRE